MAEGVTTNSARIDHLEATMNRRFDRVEDLWLDHEGRIQCAPHLALPPPMSYCI